MSVKLCTKIAHLADGHPFEYVWLSVVRWAQKINGF